MSVVLVAQHRFAHSAADVFVLCIDAERFPRTFAGYGPIPALRRIVLDGPLAVGSERDVHSSDGSVLRERVTALRPPLHHADHIVKVVLNKNLLADWIARREQRRRHLGREHTVVAL